MTNSEETQNDKMNKNGNTFTNYGSETKARTLLMEQGYEAIQSPDWLARKNEDREWICIEVKYKSELYSPGEDFPHFGIGLDISQVWLRNQLFQDLKIRTYLLVFVKDIDKVYGAYLDELEENGGYYNTPNKIRIYPVDNFTTLEDAPNQNLGV